jgi:hypothetical protein
MTRLSISPFVGFVRGSVRRSLKGLALMSARIRDRFRRFAVRPVPHATSQRSLWIRVSLICVAVVLFASAISFALLVKSAMRANRLELQAVARRYPNFTAAQRLAVLRQIQMQRHPRGRDLTFDQLVSRVAKLLASSAMPSGSQTAANFAGNLTTVSVNTNDLMALTQQPNCSLNLVDGAYSLSLGGPTFSYTVASSTPNYQQLLHNAAGLTTTPGQWPAGCGDTEVGITSRKFIFTGTTTGSVKVFASHFYNAVTGLDQIFTTTTQTNDTFQTFTSLDDPNNVADLATSDLNGDGNGDLVAIDSPVSATGNADVSIFLGKADGTFSSPAAISLPGSLAISAVIDDFNGDGKKDIVVSTITLGATSTTYYLNFLAGNGDGTFKPVQTYTETPPASAVQSSSGGPYFGLTSADLRGSGHRDLVTSAGIVLFGNGDGTFTQFATAAFPPTFATSDYGPNVVAADFNKDGKPDLALNNGDTIQIFLGNGDGTFTFKAGYASINSVGYMTAQDIDGDGNIDLWIGTGNNGSLGPDQFFYNMGYALMSNGDGTFRGAPTIANGVYTGNNVGDVNDDGMSDIITLNSTGSFSVQLGTGNGTFNPTSTITAPASFVLDGSTFTGANTLPASAFAVADLNGDGKADLAFTDVISGTGGSQNILAVYFTALSNGDGTFQAPTPNAFPQIAPTNSFDISLGITGMQISNLKKGGPASLIFTFNETGGAVAGFNSYNQGIAVLPGNGNGTYGAPVITFTNSSSSAINNNFGTQIAAIADVNGDGNPDLIAINSSFTVANGAQSQVEVFLGNGDGTFKPPTIVNTPANPTTIALADFNKDGKIDIAALCGAINANSDEIAIALGNGDGTFGTPTTMTVESDINGFGGLAAADFDGDGNVDLALINIFGTSGIFPGNGNGTFNSVTGNGYAEPTEVIYLGVFGTTGVANVTTNGKPGILVGNTVLANLYGSAVVTQPVSSSTALAATSQAVTAGSSVTFTATVTGPSGNTTVPTGTVTFYNGATSIGTGSLNASGVATLTTTTLTTGSDSITAAYGGDANFNASTSAALVVTVNPALVATSTALTASPTSAATGASIALTATVTAASGAVTPTGTVTFYNGATSIGTGSLNGSGVATLSTTTLPAGGDSITAQYGGSAAFSGSTSAAVTVAITVPPPPDFSLTISPSSGTETSSSPASATLTVTPINSFNGTVSFACSGQPSYLGCGFNPATLTPAGSAVNTTVTFGVTSVANALPNSGARPGPQPGNGSGPLVSLAFGFGFLLLARVRRYRHLFRATAALLFCIALVNIAACSKKPTPETNTVTITATSGTLSHTITYSLTSSN